MVRGNIATNKKADASEPFENIAIKFKKALSVFSKTKKQRAKLGEKPDSEMVKNLFANEHMALWALCDSLASLVVNHNMKLDKEITNNVEAYQEMVKFLIAEETDDLTQRSLLDAEAPLNKQQITYNLTKYLDLNKTTKVVNMHMSRFGEIGALEEGDKNAKKVVEKLDLDVEKENALQVAVDTVTGPQSAQERPNAGGLEANPDRKSGDFKKLSVVLPAHDGLGADWEKTAQPLTGHVDRVADRLVFQDCLTVFGKGADQWSQGQLDTLKLGLQDALQAKELRLFVRPDRVVVEVADALDRVTPQYLRQAMEEVAWPMDKVDTVCESERLRFYVPLARALNEGEVAACQKRCQEKIPALDVRAHGSEDGAPMLNITVIEPLADYTPAHVQEAQ